MLRLTAAVWVTMISDNRQHQYALSLSLSLSTLSLTPYYTPTGFDPWTVQPQDSRNTDCDFPAHHTLRQTGCHLNQ